MTTSKQLLSAFQEHQKDELICEIDYHSWIQSPEAQSRIEVRNNHTNSSNQETPRSYPGLDQGIQIGMRAGFYTAGFTVAVLSMMKCFPNDWVGLSMCAGLVVSEVSALTAVCAAGGLAYDGMRFFADKARDMAEKYDLSEINKQLYSFSP